MEESSKPIRLRVEAGQSVWLEPGRYAIDIDIPMPQVGAFLLGEFPITIRDENA